jgi:hypothetical protein
LVGFSRRLQIAAGPVLLAHNEWFWLRFAKSKPALLRLLRYPHANPATGIFVLKDDPRLLKRGFTSLRNGL